jgi:hypothetical protein
MYIQECIVNKKDEYCSVVVYWDITRREKNVVLVVAEKKIESPS